MKKLMKLAAVTLTVMLGMQNAVAMQRPIKKSPDWEQLPGLAETQVKAGVLEAARKLPTIAAQAAVGTSTALVLKGAWNKLSSGAASSLYALTLGLPSTLQGVGNFIASGDNNTQKAFLAGILMAGAAAAGGAYTYRDALGNMLSGLKARLAGEVPAVDAKRTDEIKADSGETGSGDSAEKPKEEKKAEAVKPVKTGESPDEIRLKQIDEALKAPKIRPGPRKRLQDERAEILERLKK